MMSQSAVLKETQTRQVIVPIGQNLGWLDARNAVGKKGGLPSSRLHDDVLVYSDDWKPLSNRGYYPAWAREVLVYSEVNGYFKKGTDVVDAFTDDAGRRWTFPASSIPEVAMGNNRVALLVAPEDVEVDGKRVVILAKPESVSVLTPFKPKNGWGKVDDNTRVPLKISVKGVPSNQQRFLWRMGGQGVRPLARHDVVVVGFNVVDGLRYVDANRRQDHRLGVASVELQALSRG